MTQDPLQVLRAARRPVGPPPASPPRLLVAGATGVLGNEVLHRLVGGGRYAPGAQVLAREPITAGLRGIRTTRVPGDDPAGWPPGDADVGVILFDPPRLFHDRERALWTPDPAQLPALAGWMRRSGVTTLAIVLPHAPGRLPDALKRGLASLDEHAVAMLGFDRLLIVRSARKEAVATESSLPRRLARWMLSVAGYMIPTREQPVRAVRVAQFVAAALRSLPAGTHVAPPEVVWEAAQGDVDGVVAAWLGR